MKSFSLKWITKKTLRSKSGESIMEAIVSLLILGMLMTTIVSIIRFSMAMTGDSIRDATATQIEMNNLKFDDFIDTSGESSQGSLILRNVDLGIDAGHSVVLYTDNGVIAFYPGG